MTAASSFTDSNTSEVTGQSDEGASELGSGGTVGVEGVAFKGIGDRLVSFGDAVKTSDGTYDGRGFNGLGRSLSGRSEVVLV